MLNALPIDAGAILTRMAASLRLLVGLGNPGRDHAGTRHNAGFMAIDRLAAKWGAAFSRASGIKAETARHGELRLCKPLSYMNLSGEPVAAFSRYHRIEPAETLVIYDDVALPLGRLRLRLAGSAGGHNGLQSIIDHLGTPEIPRLRIGIGDASGGAMTGHVLGKFRPEEREELEQALDRAVEAVSLSVSAGVEAAMNLFNQTKPTTT